MATTTPPPSRRTPSPLEAAMAVHAEGLRDDRAADTERARRLGILAADRRDTNTRAEAAVAEQKRRTRVGEGTPIEEVLNGRDRSIVREFLHYVSRAFRDDGLNRFDLATTLPVTRNGSADTVRGFLIGCTGEEPGDSSWIKSARGLYLCEDGRLRTYRRPDRATSPDNLPPAEGVPVHPATGDYVPIIPGYFTEATAPRRRAITLTDGRIPPLPPGVESGSTPYRDAGLKTLYQTHAVHLYKVQSLEESLAATAYHIIREEEPRPMYDRFSPDI